MMKDTYKKDITETSLQVLPLFPRYSFVSGDDEDAKQYGAKKRRTKIIQLR